MRLQRSWFLSEGLAATEMKEIAHRSSISRSTLYRMFESRETLAFRSLTSVCMSCLALSRWIFTVLINPDLRYCVPIPTIWWRL